MKDKSGTASKCIVVFDVGKTNQKILVYDQQLSVIDSEYEAFSDIESDGITQEDVISIITWFKNTMKAMSRNHDIGAISITTHGAAFTCLDKDGELVLPVVSYTYEPGDEFQEQFCREFGDPISLQRETATPNYPGLGCIAKGIYFVQKEFPDRFVKTRSILNLPQFYGYFLTGKKGIEPTYLGCTTFLWDFYSMGYSSMVDKLGIRTMLPVDILKPWDILGTISPRVAEETGLSVDTIVTLGIHDSNSALLPYLVKMKESFVLDSTGTFCVAMHPSRDVSFKTDELGKYVFYNIDAFSNPVKTALFLGGMEFDIYMGIISNIHGQKQYPAFSPELYEQIATHKELFIIPGGVTGGGMFPDSETKVIEKGEEFSFDDIISGTRRPEFFNDFTLAYGVLNLSLAIESQVAMKSVGLDHDKSIYVEGGFHNNDSYCALIKSLNPNSAVYLSGLNEATAFGAALVGKCALEKKTPHDLGGYFEIETQPVPLCSIEGLDAYMKRFLHYTGKDH